MSTKRELVTNSIVPRIKAVLTAAEQTAALVAEEAESEASRRTSELLAGADADAERIRREATRRVEEYLAASRRRIDAFATARIERITELSEGVIEAATSIQERFEQASAVQREVHAMVEALGAVAQAVANEAAVASPTLPRAPAGPGGGEGGPSWAQTGPDGSVVGETLANGRAFGHPSEGDADTGVHGSDGRLVLDLGQDHAGKGTVPHAQPADAEAELDYRGAADSGDDGGFVEAGWTDRESGRTGREDADWSTREGGEETDLDGGGIDRDDDGEMAPA